MVGYFICCRGDVYHTHVLIGQIMQEALPDLVGALRLQSLGAAKPGKNNWMLWGRYMQRRFPAV